MKTFYATVLCLLFTALPAHAQPWGSLPAGSSFSQPRPATAIAIDAGMSSTCAVMDTGEVKCWGIDMMRFPHFAHPRYQPWTVPGLLPSTDVAIGSDFTCSLSRTAVVQCWGQNALGQLGNGDARSHAIPVTVPLAGDVIDIAAGFDHACALASSGHITCWGRNSEGQAGPALALSIPPTTAAVIPEAASIVAGYTNTCVLANTVVCWGDRNGGGINATAAAQFTINTQAVKIAAGEDTACLSTPEKLIYCWGGNTLMTTSSPLVGSSPRISARGTTIAVSKSHACHVLPNSTVECMGANKFGQAGGETRQPTSVWTAIPGPVNITELALGINHSCALSREGTVWCWGANYDGQRGQARNSIPETPPFAAASQVPLTT